MSDLGNSPLRTIRFSKGTPQAGFPAKTLSALCEDFVRAVRRHAVGERKARDNEYIADYAMSCLTDEALHWSENISEEVQGDWSLLRRALLSEYGTMSGKPLPVAASLPSAMIPIAAAAPPPAAPSPQARIPMIATPVLPPPQTLRGRIRMNTRGFTGYLSKHLDDGSSNEPEHFKWVCLTTTELSDACIVFGTTGNGGWQFTMENLENPSVYLLGNHLGIVWSSKNRAASGAYNGYAALTAVNVQGFKTTSKKSTPSLWTGPASWVTWIRAPDNTLTPKLDGLPDVGIAISSSGTGGKGHHIEIVSRIDSFVGGAWKKASFVFEPI